MTTPTDTKTRTRKAPAKAAPAKRAPAKAAAKAPARKAPANTGAKLRWTTTKVHADGKDQTATGHDGAQYAIARNTAGQYVATHKGTKAPLATGKFSAAYWAVVKHNQALAAKAAAKAA